MKTLSLFPIGLMISLFLVGCAAPLNVQEAQAWESNAWAAYIRNADRIVDLQLEMFKSERQARTEAATQDALARVKARAVDGKLPVEDFTTALTVLTTERDKAKTQTETLVARVKSLAQANNAEAAKALRIHGKMAEWLEAGMDESAIPGLVQETIGLIQSFNKPATGGN